MSFDPVNVEFLINNAKVKADAAAVKSEIMGVDATAAKSAKKVSEVVTKAYAQNARSVDEYARAVGASNAALAANTRQVAMARPQFNTLGNSVNQIMRELPNFAISAQVGFMALSNNIPILADEITKLKKANDALIASGQKSIPIWKSVLGVLMNWQTLLLVGVSLTIAYSRQIGEFFSKLFKGKAAIDAVKMSQESLNKSFESKSYKEALQSVIEMRGAFDLAKQGVLDKTEVLDQYNEGLGKVFGTATDVLDAENKFIANSDKYVEAMLYREAANLQAAESAAGLAKLNKERDELLLKQEEAQRKVTAYNSMSPEQKARLAAADPLMTSEGDLDRIKKTLDANEKMIEKYITESIKSWQRLKGKESAFGLNLDPDDPTGTSAVSGRQSLLDQIAALDREYARKKLDDDEAEVQALKDKLDRMRELVIRFNADPKNKDKIAMSDLDAVGRRSMANLREKQAADNLAKIRGEAERARAEQEAAWAKELESLQDYQAKRQALTDDYQARREALLKSGKSREADILDQQYQAELDALDDSEVKKLAKYRMLFQNVNQLTAASMKAQLAKIRSAVNAGEVGGVKLSDAELEKLIGLASELSDTIEEMPIARMRQISGALRTLGSDWAGVADQIDIAAQAMTAFEEIQAFRTTGASPIPALTAMIGLIGMVEQGIREANAQARANRDALIDYMLSLQDYERTHNEIMRRVAIEQADANDMTLAGIKERSAAYSQALNESKADQEELLRLLYEEGQFVSGIGLKVKNKGFLQGGKVVTENEYTSLIGKTIEEIEALYSQGKLSERAAQLFDQLRQLQQEGADLQAMLDDLTDSTATNLLGATAESMADGITEGLKSGYDSVADFAADLERMLQSAILNAISMDVLQPEINKWRAAFAEMMQDGTLSESEAEELRQWYADITQMGLDAYNEASKVVDTNKLGTSSGGGLKGAIQRELTEATASELTGLYRATYDLQKKAYEVGYMHYLVDQQVLSATMRQVAHSAAIETNTRDTVLELRKVVKEMKLLNGTGTTGDSYDRGTV